MKKKEQMPIASIPDWEKRLARQDALWEREIIDRPVVHIIIPKKKPAVSPPPEKKYQNWRQKWLDFEYRADCLLAEVKNTEYLGDALPRAIPNMGPEVFSAFFGTEMDYNETTSWSIPNLHDWKDADRLQLSQDNFFWKKLVEFTELLLAKGRNAFYVGLTDLHPGGDAIAAFRDPLNLNIDMIENPEEVKKLLKKVTEAYFFVFDYFCGKLQKAGQAITTWLPVVSTRKWYTPSNDFSCMISKEMFDDIFLPRIVEECRHQEASVYHLDGPGALRHLDSLLEIKELNAIQWQYGAGHGRASDWLQVYKKCQSAGKGLYITPFPDEIDTFLKELKPEGVSLVVYGVKDREEAEAILKKVARWK